MAKQKPREGFWRWYLNGMRMILSLKTLKALGFALGSISIVMLAPLGFAMLFVGGVPLWPLLPIVCIIVGITSLAWLFYYIDGMGEDC